MNHANDMEDLEKKIMGEITSGRVTLRSRYLFLVEKLGLGSAMVLTILLGSLLVSLVLWYLKNSEMLSYLSFGSDGLLAFWEHFPYGLIISAIIIILLSGYILKKSGWLYRLSFGTVALGFVISLCLISAALSFTSVPEKIGREEFKATKPIFKPILPGQKHNRNGLIGKIIVWDSPTGTVLTIHGLRPIDTTFTPAQERERIKTGVHIMAIGKPQAEVFIVRHIKIIPEDKLPAKMLH